MSFINIEDDQSAENQGLRKQNAFLENKIESLLQETKLKDKYETIIKDLKSSSEKKQKHITFLQQDTENKNKLLKGRIC